MLACDEYFCVYYGRYMRKNSRGKWVYRSRIIMQEHLGRELTRHEIVHHKDHDKLNDDISNLELTDRGKHCRDHDPIQHREKW